MKGHSVLLHARIIGFSVIIALLTVSVSAQFPIKIPKIPKITKEKPQTPQTTSADTSTASPSSSANPVSARTSEIRAGVPVPGAKVFFSTTPFTDSSAGAKSTFTSQEFIYGRLELNKSIGETFGLSKMPKRDYYYIRYKVFLPREEKVIWVNQGNHLYLSKEDIGKTYLNFDVLPDPNNINSVLAVADELWNYKFPASIGGQIKQSARSVFPSNGDYPITVVLFQANFDDYGEPKFNEDPLPYAAGQFTFQFMARDVPDIVANYDKAVANAESARNRRDTLKSLPDWWGKTKAPADPKLTVARLTPLLRDYTREATYLNKFVWGEYSLPLWTIHKDSYGLPSYRFGPQLWALYKHNKDGTCFFVRYSPRETYSGAGTYGQLHLQAMTNYTYVDCAAVK